MLDICASIKRMQKSWRPNRLNVLAWPHLVDSCARTHRRALATVRSAAEQAVMAFSSQMAVLKPPVQRDWPAGMSQQKKGQGVFPRFVAGMHACSCVRGQEEEAPNSGRDC